MAIDKTLGRNRSITDTALISSAIALNSSTSTTVASLFLSRMNFTFSNSSNKDLWLKYQAASVDNDKKGIWVPRNSVFEMTADNYYTGEISAIAVTGTPNINVTEY